MNGETLCVLRSCVLYVHIYTPLPFCVRVNCHVGTPNIGLGWENTVSHTQHVCISVCRHRTSCVPCVAFSSENHKSMRYFHCVDKGRLNWSDHPQPVQMIYDTNTVCCVCMCERARACVCMSVHTHTHTHCDLACPLQTNTHLSTSP